jgi:N-acetyl sugar amidotransferase
MVLSKDDPNYRQCSVTVMDNIADPEIQFDQEGVSNYVHDYYKHFDENIPADPKQQLEEVIDKIKKEGKNKPYDCLTGISGGVDSSYLIYKAKEWGLRPLIVHFDNGWNTEISVRNINNIINKTGFELYTLVVNWEEFRDLQLSYIKAGVVDLEVPTDHAIYATWFKLAKKFKLKYVLSGNNYITESIMPNDWIFNKADAVNLMNIRQKFGQIKLKTYPIVKPLQQVLNNYMLDIKVVKPLNMIPYNKTEAKETLRSEFGWADYGGKHYESFYTKFYQAYILPQKFKIDKRKPHLSNLILAKQIDKAEAIKELQMPLYNENELRADTEYFIKKMGITEAFFKEYLTAPRVNHLEYGKQGFIKDTYPILKLFRPVYKLIKGKP